MKRKQKDIVGVVIVDCVAACLGLHAAQREN